VRANLYDPETMLPELPGRLHGAVPGSLYPQRFAEIMAGRFPCRGGERRRSARSTSYRIGYRTQPDLGGSQGGGRPLLPAARDASPRISSTRVSCCRDLARVVLAVLAWDPVAVTIDRSPFVETCGPANGAAAIDRIRRATASAREVPADGVRRVQTESGRGSSRTGRASSSRTPLHAASLSVERALGAQAFVERRARVRASDSSRVRPVALPPLKPYRPARPAATPALRDAVGDTVVAVPDRAGLDRQRPTLGARWLSTRRTGATDTQAIADAYSIRASRRARTTGPLGRERAVANRHVLLLHANALAARHLRSARRLRADGSRSFH
jgi:hypothetical protein